MPLKLRPSGLGSGIDKDRPDYKVCTGEWEVGRIYQARSGPDSLRWFWSLTVNGPMTRAVGWRPLKGPRRSFKELGRLECVGEAGRGLLTSLGPLAAFSNRRRFFVNLLRGVMPFRRGRYQCWSNIYQCWSNICGRSGGLGNDFISRRFGDAPG
jgi:hypothetical protein